MSGRMRYWSLAGVLVAGVGVAVAVASAQGMPPPAPGQPAREMMVLDGRGSRLGVMVQDLEPTDKAAGVRVDAVDRDGPAEKAGLKAGDIVVEYDGERVRSARQFTRLVQETAEGRQVPLAVLRDGTRQTLTATPEARAFSWNIDIDGDRIRRDVERGLREFRMDPPAMHFRMEPGFGAMFFPWDRPRLGVSVNSLSDQLAQYFGAGDGGALVTSVDPGSAAEKAGLKAGDVITAINGDRVRDAEQVIETMRDVREGAITIDYLRDRKSGSTTATIEPRREERPRTPATPGRPVRPASHLKGA